MIDPIVDHSELWHNGSTGGTRGAYKWLARKGARPCIYSNDSDHMPLPVFSRDGEMHDRAPGVAFSLHSYFSLNAAAKICLVSRDPEEDWRTHSDQ